MEDFPRQLIDLLETHGSTLSSDLRYSMTKALILLRNRNLLSPTVYALTSVIRLLCALYALAR
jgi:protein SDA1